MGFPHPAPPLLVPARGSVSLPPSFFYPICYMIVLACYLCALLVLVSDFSIDRDEGDDDGICTHTRSTLPPSHSMKGRQAHCAYRSPAGPPDR